MYDKLIIILIIYLACSGTATRASENSDNNRTMQLHPDKEEFVDIHNTRLDSLFYIADKERGPECPTGSGEYCTAESNYCCLVNNSWTCVANLEDCKNE